MEWLTLTVTVPFDPDFPMSPEELRDAVRDELRMMGAAVEIAPGSEVSQ